MMKYIATALAAILLVGCSQEAPPSETSAVAPPAAPAVAETSLATFVERATIGDLYEVTASQVALERSQNAGVRSFAQAMIEAHTATTQQLLASLDSVTNAPTPSTALDARHQQWIDELRAAPANEFDARYLDQQTEAHENALSLLRTYADGGDNDVVRAFAAQTAPTVEQHLATVRSLDSAGADENPPS